jgi:hypothetical protein
VVVGTAIAGKSLDSRPAEGRPVLSLSKGGNDVGEAIAPHLSSSRRTPGSSSQVRLTPSDVCAARRTLSLVIPAKAGIQ